MKSVVAYSIFTFFDRLMSFRKHLPDARNVDNFSPIIQRECLKETGATGNQRAGQVGLKGNPPFFSLDYERGEES